VLGTTDYVSPEQALGHEVTEQSDIYSLGIVLYEMLAGEAPFRADTQVAVAMKHVKEPLPDVQRLRPEISAALAAVVERATAKETRNRYATIEEMVHDLEQVLAIEAARAGEASGEATTILRSLPGDTADFAPGRLRHPRRTMAVAVAVLALVAGAIAYFATRTEKGAGGAVTPGAQGLSDVRLGQSAAHDYDPEGDDGQEHPEATQNGIDGQLPTYWETETYQGGQWPGGKTGVGLYLDAGKPIEARRLVLSTSTPGFEAAVYGAPNAVPDSVGKWTPLSSRQTVSQDAQFTLDTARQRFRYYLLWITSLPADGKARIQELSLKR
jgi:serine/threonine-protein kinase